MTSRHVNIRIPALSLLVMTGLISPFALAEQPGVPVPNIAKQPDSLLAINPRWISKFDPKSPICTMRATKYFRFHIRNGFFSNLTPNAICALAPGKTGCNWMSNGNAAGDDDDTTEMQPLPAVPEGNQQPDWDTSLDINLGGFGGAKNVIQIKVILDDPDMQFIHSQTASNTDSDFAVMQGAASKGMFICRRTVSPLPHGAGSSVIVRVMNNGIRWGSLNIGILYTGGGIVLPMYIDPKVHNDG